MTMVETVARAICIAEGYADPDEDWTCFGGVQLSIALPLGEKQRWRVYIRAARAAISAMREPTAQMVKAAEAISDDWTAGTSEWTYVRAGGEAAIFQTMIDAALNQQPDTAPQEQP